MSAVSQPVLLPSSENITRISISKKYQLPPRPKPGRKPTTQPPQTKRKAQNREAQRAYRERRANRVQELEEKLMILQRDLVVKDGLIGGFKNEVSRLRQENIALKNKLKLIEKVRKSSIEIEAPISLNSPPSDSLLDSCDDCNGDNCACETLGIKPTEEQKKLDFTNFKREEAVPLKRKSEEEIDFTERFKIRKMPSLPFENCGFCDDTEGASCVCKEAAEREQLEKENLKKEIEIKEQNLISQILKDVQTSDSDIVQCSGNPGSCSKCQVDKNLAEFCTTIQKRVLLPKQKPMLAIPIPDAYRAIKIHSNTRHILPPLNTLNIQDSMVEVKSVVSCIRELDRGFARSL